MYASRPFEELRKDYPSLVILRGVELSTDAGHMLVYGIDDTEWNDWGKYKMCNGQELIDRVRKLGVLPSRRTHGRSWKVQAAKKACNSL